jgi:hypothetical protein
VNAARALLRTLWACALLLGASGLAHAQPLGLASESAVKAAFIYKFGGFVEWPAGAFRAPDDPLVIGVFGDDGIASELEQLTRGRFIDRHPVKVVRVREADELMPLHVLYAGGPRESRVREVLASVRGPVLTVTDGPVGGNPGPVLYFTEEDGRVRFHASITAAAAHNLKLSARLLAVAQQVEGH